MPWVGQLTWVGEEEQVDDVRVVQWPAEKGKAEV